MTSNRTSVLCPSCGYHAEATRFLMDTNGNKVCHRCYNNQQMAKQTPSPGPFVPFPSYYEKYGVGQVVCR